MNPREKHTNRKARESAAPAIDWRATWHLLRRNAWIITLCVVVAGFGGAAYLARAPKIYEARTVVQVEQAEQKVINIQDISQEDLRAAELLKTIEQNLTSSDLLLRVVKNTGLASDPRLLPGAGALPFGDEQLLRALSRKVTAKLRRGTRLIDIAARHTSPEVAQIIAQGVVKEYLRQNFEQRVGMSQIANEFLLEEAARLKAKLEHSEQALQAYREQNQTVSLENTQNITVDALRELSTSYNEAKAARMKLEAEHALAKSLAHGSPDEWLAIPSVANAPDVLEARKAMSDKELEIATLSKRYRSEHPKYIQAQSQSRELKASFEQRLRKALDSVKTQYESAIVTETKFQEALAGQQKQALDLNRLAIPYASLTRELESDRAMYQAVVTRLKETDVTKGVESNNVRIVESARLPRKPVSPMPLFIMELSLLSGVMLGVGLAFGLNALDSSVRTVDAAEEHLGVPAFAAIPIDAKVKSGPESLVIVRQPESATAEAFRSLRTSITLKGEEAGRIALFTSAVPAEGKSFCSVNTAAAFAQQGFRTLLIDADLRRPTVSKVFQPAGTAAAGLTEHLASGVPLADLLLPTKIENLTLLAAGAVARNPAELLKSDKLAELFASPVLGSFDRIVIDSAPVNAVSDTLHLVRFADVICLVIRAGSTPKRSLLRAYHELVESSARMIGLVVNRLPKTSGAGYYYYSAGSYGEAGVYGQKRASKA